MSMKKYLNPQCAELSEHLSVLKAKGIRTTMYNEMERPKHATRFWISYDISAEADGECRKNLYTWLSGLNAESFGNSIASFLIKGMCINNNTKAAKWLIKQLIDANVLIEDMDADENVDYLKTKGLSLYIIWRSRNIGDGSNAKRYSDHFVLIQNTKIWHKGGYNENDAD